MPNVWIDTIISMNIPVANSETVSLMTGVSATQTRFDRMTLRRTLIGVDIARILHDSGEGSEQVACGVGIASQEVFAAGQTADPETSTDFPIRGWIWRAQYRIFGYAADQPAVFDRRLDLDLRSQRKLENGEAYFKVRVDTENGVSSNVLISGMIRQLWLVG